MQWIVSAAHKNYGFFAAAAQWNGLLLIYLVFIDLYVYEHK